MEAMTANLPSDKPEPTIDELLASAKEALCILQPIGTLYEQVVYLHHWDRTLTFAGQTVSVDHPFLAGTKIHTAALLALGEICETAPV